MSRITARAVKRLAAAGDRDPRLSRDRHAECTMDEPLATLEDAAIGDIHRRDARKRLRPECVVECSRIHVHLSPRPS
jgi:hypothetical protein